MNRVLVLAFIVCFSYVGYGQGASDTAQLHAKPDAAHASAESGILSIHSEPEGAEIYQGSRLIGVTPIDSLIVMQGIHIYRSFYPSARFWNPVSSLDTVLVLSSQKNMCLVRFGVLANNGIFKRQVITPEHEPAASYSPSVADNDRSWIGYASGATMIVTGAASAYLKTNSDNYFNTYISNRDPNLLSKVRRLDRWAGISLFISEISFGVLTYILLSE